MHDYGIACKNLMRLIISNGQLLQHPELPHPLFLYFHRQILTYFEFRKLIHEDASDKDLVDVFKMDLSLAVYVLSKPQFLQNINYQAMLYNDLFLLINIARISVVDSIVSSLEFLALECALLRQLMITERRWQLNI